MINFSPDINLGNTIVTGLIAGLAVGVRRLYKLVKDAIVRHDQALDDVCDHAEAINLHTTILYRAGLTKGIQLPLMEERRKKPRVYTQDGPPTAAV